jgi:hypothetical protein
MAPSVIVGDMAGIIKFVIAARVFVVCMPVEFIWFKKLFHAGCQNRRGVTYSAIYRKLGTRMVTLALSSFQE